MKYLILITAFIFSSCVVYQHEFTLLEEIDSVHVGMTLDEVQGKIGKPHKIATRIPSGSDGELTIYVYLVKANVYPHNKMLLKRNDKNSRIELKKSWFNYTGIFFQTRGFGAPGYGDFYEVELVFHNGRLMQLEAIDYRRKMPEKE